MLALLLLVCAAEPPTVEAATPANEPAPVVVDPATEATEPAFVDDTTLSRIATENVQAGRPLLRRTARSAPSAESRALAVRLLGTFDPSSATGRICARALRLDGDPRVRRAAAECIGRLGPDFGVPHTPALVAALGDPTLDVVTMVGWALANVGDAGSVVAVAERARDPDERVASLFSGYVERMRTRLGLIYEARDAEDAYRDEEGRTLVPPSHALLSTSRGLDLAASTGWLGVYGGVLGWLHGAYLLSAHGGKLGADTAALGGLAGAALGAAAGSMYGYTRAKTFVLSHTVVQLGSFGTFGGYGAGLLSGFPPTSAVASANLSFVGSLAGTAVGVALVESAPPTIGSLGTGMVSALAFGTATGALFRGYGLGDQFSVGAALLGGSAAGTVATLGTSRLDVGLFPLAGGAAGTLVGAGAGSLLAFIVEPDSFTEATGWIIASGTLGGGALGTFGGALLPRDKDPFLSDAVHVGPPVVSFVPSARGEPVPAMVVAGAF